MGEAVVYIACVGWFLGLPLVARVPLSPPSTGQRVGFVLLLLAFVASVWGLVMSVPGGPSLLLSNSVTALFCGFTLGFGVLSKRDRSAQEAPRPLPPSGPLREEAPWVVQLTGGVMALGSLFNLAEMGNSGRKFFVGEDLLGFGFTGLLLWLGLAVMVLPPRWKVALGVGGGALALLVGTLLPPRTL